MANLYRHILIWLAISLCSLPSPSFAIPLVADSDSRGIEINSSFTGKDLLLFGARNKSGNIVLVVRGPNRDFIVREKQKIAGIWINTNQLKFSDVPGFYAIASNSSLSQVHNEGLIDHLQIGTNHLNFQPENVASRYLLEKLPWFENALLEHLRQDHLYPPYAAVEPISFMGDTLFRSSIRFPEKIPKGTYTAEFYLFNDGMLTGIQSTPIVVEKVGFDAFVYNMAYRHSFLYGFTAITIALLAGWFASVIFQKRKPIG